MNLLYFIPEPVDTHRADVAVLFGRALAEVGVRTCLVAAAGGTVVPERAWRFYTPNTKGGRLRRELAYLGCVCRALWRESPDADLIQVRDMVPVGLLALAWARLRRKPFVYWMSYLMSEGRMERAAVSLSQAEGVLARLKERLVWLKGYAEAALLYGWLLKRADHVFVQSAAMRSHVIARRVPAERVTAVPMGIDASRFRRETLRPQRLPGWDGCHLVAYLGTLERTRQLNVVVEALSLVRQQFQNARLLLIGDGPQPADVEFLRSCIQSHGLDDSVHITGWLAPAEALPLLVGADVAVSYIPRTAILDVSSPTKIIEYVALEVPSVGNDSPDQEIVLRSSGAGIVTRSTATALADGIIAVLSEPQLARQRAALGPSYVRKERSYGVIAAGVEAVYRELLSGRR